MYYRFLSQICIVILSFLSCGWILDTSKIRENKQIIHYYVSTEGKDHWSGLLAEPNADSSDGPFASLEKACQVIQGSHAARSNDEIAVVINVRGGTYSFQHTLLLDSLVSGTAANPMVVQNYQDEAVHIVGGVKVSGFDVVSSEEILRQLPQHSRDSVWELNLKDAGITNYGELKPRGFPRHTSAAPLELFFNRKPMQLARWPNQGWARIDQHMDKSYKDHFTYTGQRPDNWIKSSDAWLHGFFGRDWADSYAKIKHIDTLNHQIETYEPHGSYGYAPNGRYYALNLIEELDQPGEWYLDRKTGMLYFWPPTPIQKGEVYISMLDQPLIELNNASYVHIRGITFEITRGVALIIKGGKENQIGKSTFRNVGNHAVEINNGSHTGVIGCDFYDLGEGGIILTGGDRLTLTPAENYVKNSYFHHYNRWVMSSKPAVFIQGVGNVVQHNVMHDAPQEAIHLTGNDHLIEYNEVFRVGQETGDIGAFYMGRDLSMQGNMIRYNYFHDMRSSYKHGVKSIYLDDFAGGTTIYGNIFSQVQQGILVNGGSDNAIENNLFINVKEAIRMNHRAASSFKAVEATLHSRLNAVDYRSATWKKYPKLETAWERNPATPQDNRALDNVCLSCSRCITIRKEDKDKQMIKNNKVVGNTMQDPILEDVVNKLMEKSIPLEKIGLYQDDLRLTLPEYRLKTVQ